MQQSDSGRELDGETSDEQQYNSDGANACNGVRSKGNEGLQGCWGSDVCLRHSTSSSAMTFTCFFSFAWAGQPWTESEHRAFVAGLAKLGKGNWRGISKQFVPTRTPTQVWECSVAAWRTQDAQRVSAPHTTLLCFQVASHAQKYFMRLAGATKRKSRFTALENEVGM